MFMPMAWKRTSKNAAFWLPMLLACPHMVDATACLGWGGMIAFFAFAHRLDAAQLWCCLHARTWSMLEPSLPRALEAAGTSARPLGRFRCLNLRSRPSKYGLCRTDSSKIMGWGGWPNWFRHMMWCSLMQWKLAVVELQGVGHTAGQMWVRCPNFWVRGHDDKPVCWHGCCWLGEVPRSVLQQQQRLRKDLRWQLQHGPQTKQWERESAGVMC